MKKRTKQLILIAFISSFILSPFILIKAPFFLSSYKIGGAKGIRIVKDPSDDSILIMWYTDLFDENSRLLYSNNPVLLNPTIIEPTVKIIGSTYIYTAKLRDLNEGEVTYYTIESYFLNRREIKSFINPSTKKEFTFLVWGDTQARYGSFHERTIRNYLAEKAVNFPIDFVLHMGDITQDGLYQDLWNLYFTDTEVLNSRTVSYYVEGNHDKLSHKIEKNLNLPLYYSFKMKNSIFIGLSSERLINEQAKWLEKKLERNKDVKYKFLFFHRPLYDYLDPLDKFEEVIKKYDITVVFNGHRHYYKRLTVNDTIHIITGGGGGRLRGTNKSKDNHEYEDICKSVHNFVIVKVRDDCVKIKALGLKDRQSDLYEIESYKIS